MPIKFPIVVPHRSMFKRRTENMFCVHVNNFVLLNCCFLVIVYVTDTRKINKIYCLVNEKRSISIL